MQKSIMDFCSPSPGKKSTSTPVKNKTAPVEDGELLSPNKKAKGNDATNDEGEKIVQLGLEDFKVDPSIPTATAMTTTATTTATTTTTTTSQKPAVPTSFTFEKLEDGLPEEWKIALKDEFTKPYWKKLKDSLCAERNAGSQIFPEVKDIFAAFHACPMDNIKVFLCGQDPYHDDNQAMGLAFSVPKSMKKLPPSLKNLYKELETDIKGFKTPPHGDLSSWAEQGVFMLNTVLTVRAHKANSHESYGWLTFTDAVINFLATKKEKIVYIAWGKPAEKKVSKVDKKKNCVIIGVHPSPLSASRGFFGSKPFSQTNDYLLKNGFKPINWQP